MGWCSATQIFDAAVQATKEPDKIKDCLVTIINMLENYDWDCQQDSAYWDDPIVQEIFKERNPNWFE